MFRKPINQRVKFSTATKQTPKDVAASLKIGTVGEYKEQVQKAHTTNRTKRPGDDILMSPIMILWMERACVAASEPKFPPGFASVGWHVDVKHLAPTPLGKTVRTTGKLLEIQGSKLTFEVAAYEGERLIGSGIHRRAILGIDPDNSNDK